MIEQNVKPPGNDARHRRGFWALYAFLYDAIWDSPITHALADAALTLVPDKGTVVDLGCGTGLFSQPRSGRVIGIDTSGAMLRRARASGRIDRALRRPAEQTGLPAACADGVLVANLLHLHPRPEAVLTEAMRICADDGVVFACWPLDTADSLTILETDVRHGRNLLHALSADALRRLVVLPAVLSGITRNSAEDLERLLGARAGSDVIVDRTAMGCQRIVALRPVANRQSTADESQLQPQQRAEARRGVAIAMPSTF